MSDGGKIIFLYSYLALSTWMNYKTNLPRRNKQTCSVAIRVKSELREFIKWRVVISKSKPGSIKERVGVNKSYQKPQRADLDVQRFKVLGLSDTKYKVNVLHIHGNNV